MLCLGFILASLSKSYQRPYLLSRDNCLSFFLFMILLVSSAAGCFHATRRDPSSLTFLIESSPTNLDPRSATDSQSQRIDGLPRSNGAVPALSSSCGPWNSPPCFPTSPREISKSLTSGGSAPTPIPTFLNILSRQSGFRPMARTVDTTAIRASTRSPTKFVLR